MALSLEDLEYLDQQSERVEVFANYSGVDDTPSLEDAYQGLLDKRNAIVIPGDDSNIKLTEDDLLVNKNLQTACLFNRLNDEYKQKQLKLEEYTVSLKTIQDTPSKINANIEALKKIYMSNSMESVESLGELNDKIGKYFNESTHTVTKVITSKISELENNIEDLTRKLNALRSLIVTGVNQIVKPEDVQKKMCPVCFDNEVNIALVPCGHTYCKGCSEADRSRYAKCPQCRAQINARVKIFFSI